MRATSIKSSVSKTNYTAFDVFGPMTERQQITDENVYSTAYEYNLSGALVKETYPSGCEVSDTFHGNGDLASMWSKKSGGISKVYLNDIVRDTTGSIRSLRLGNGRFENAIYNSRQEITQIGIGSSATDSGLLKVKFSYTTPSTTNLTGSIREQ
ncbi:MAG: hypothetical protein JNL64_00125 [Blastocatellia bacterium]|nr:hypothetical protein [Blastocatellia bacterium]